MKKRVFLGLTGSVCLLMYGCNGDVFIDEFLPETPLPTLSDKQNEQVIPFSSGNWDIQSVSCSRTDVTLAATDWNGNNIGLPFQDGELGKVQLHNEFFDCSIEKENPCALKLTSSVNLYDNPVEIYMQVGNQTESKNITVTFLPDTKYQLDSVRYEWGKLEIDTLFEKIESFTIGNSSDKPLNVYIYPFRNASREVQLSGEQGNGSWEEEVVMRYLGDPPPLFTIPDLKEGKLVLENTQVAFTYEPQYLTGSIPKDSLEVLVLPPRVRKQVSVFIDYQRYELPCTLYTSNPITRKTKIFTGRLRSKFPFDYMLFKQNTDQCTDQ